VVSNNIHPVSISEVRVESFAYWTLNQISQTEIMISRQIGNDLATPLTMICMSAPVIPEREKYVAKSIILSQPEIHPVGFVTIIRAPSFAGSPFSSTIEKVAKKENSIRM